MLMLMGALVYIYTRSILPTKNRPTVHVSVEHVIAGIWCFSCVRSCKMKALKLSIAGNPVELDRTC